MLYLKQLPIILSALQGELMLWDKVLRGLGKLKQR